MAQRRKAVRKGAPRVVRRNPEDDLQQSIVDWLHVTLVPPALYWHTPNGGLRSKRTAAKFKALGTRAGIPDLFVLHGGRLLGIELKAPRATLKRGGLSNAAPRLSDEQARMHTHLNACGCPTVVCRSLVEVERFLRVWAVPLRASALAR